MVGVGVGVATGVGVGDGAMGARVAAGVTLGVGVAVTAGQTLVGLGVALLPDVEVWSTSSSGQSPMVRATVDVRFVVAPVLTIECEQVAETGSATSLVNVPVGVAWTFPRVAITGECRVIPTVSFGPKPVPDTVTEPPTAGVVSLRVVLAVDVDPLPLPLALPLPRPLPYSHTM